MVINCPRREWKGRQVKVGEETWEDRRVEVWIGVCTESDPENKYPCKITDCSYFDHSPQTHERLFEAACKQSHRVREVPVRLNEPLEVWEKSVKLAIMEAEGLFVDHAEALVEHRKDFYVPTPGNA